jgi:ubiquinone/menaquinone biosynthesis C-methylase UbiE
MRIEKNISEIYRIIVALAASSAWPEAGDKILDFGCGSGNLVCEFRNRGFEAYGFDIKCYLSEEAKANQSWFIFKDPNEANHVDFVIGEDFSLPYSDNTFDIVISCTTIEHVSDLKSVARELARITKKDGVNLHIFPPRRSLVDGHIFVPFATYRQFQNYPWFLLMAVLGIRNNYQKGFTAHETAIANLNYCKTGLFFRSDREVQQTFADFFREVEYKDRQLYACDVNEYSIIKSYLRALISKNKLERLSLAPRVKTLFAVK